MTLALSASGKAQCTNMRIAGRVAGESRLIDFDIVWEALTKDENVEAFKVGKLKFKLSDYDLDDDHNGSILFSAQLGIVQYAMRVYYKSKHAYKVVFWVFIQGNNLKDEDEQSTDLQIKSKLDVNVAIARFNNLREQLANHLDRNNVFVPTRQFKLGKFTMRSDRHGKYFSLEEDKVAEVPLVFLQFSRNGVVEEFELNGVSSDENGKEVDGYDCVKQNQKFFAGNRFKSPADFVNKLKSTRVWARLATLETTRYWTGRALRIDTQFGNTEKEPKTINDIESLHSDERHGKYGYLILPSQEAYQTVLDALIDMVNKSGGKVLLSTKGALK